MNGQNRPLVKPKRKMVSKFFSITIDLVMLISSSYTLSNHLYFDIIITKRVSHNDTSLIICIANFLFKMFDLGKGRKYFLLS